MRRLSRYSIALLCLGALPGWLSPAGTGAARTIKANLRNLSIEKIDVPRRVTVGHDFSLQFFVNVDSLAEQLKPEIKRVKRGHGVRLSEALDAVDILPSPLFTIEKSPTLSLKEDGESYYAVWTATAHAEARGQGTITAMFDGDSNRRESVALTVAGNPANIAESLAGRWGIIPIVVLLTGAFIAAPHSRWPFRRPKAHGEMRNLLDRSALEATRALRRARVQAVLAMACALAGFGYLMINPPELSPASQGSVSAADIAQALPGLLLFIGLQLAARFLLQEYRKSLDDHRHYEEELRQREWQSLVLSGGADEERLKLIALLTTPNRKNEKEAETTAAP